MLVFFKIILAIVSLWTIDRATIPDVDKKTFKELRDCSIITGGALCIWLIVDLIIDFSFLTGIFLVAFVILYILLCYFDFWIIVLYSALIVCVVGVVGFFVGFANYLSYQEPCDTTHITTDTIEIMSATDGTMVEGKVSGGGGFLVYHVYGSINENPIYTYYYRLEDGGIKLGQIPANSTTIYYIENTEKPYIEVTTITSCNGYDKRTGEHHLIDSSSPTYKLFVPEGSIAEIFQFDGS